MQGAKNYDQLYPQRQTKGDAHRTRKDDAGGVGKERGTRLVGSFGNEKKYYLLQRVNARNAVTEKCWIFFGIFTANASIITNRREREKSKRKRG